MARRGSSKGAPIKTVFAVLVTIVSIVSYVVLATRFGIWQRWPFPHYLGALAGAVWLALLIRQRFTWPRALAMVFCLLLTSLFFYWTVVFSSYETREHAAKPGEILAELPALALPGATGTPTPLFTGQERAILLVFYRGSWCPYCRAELAELERHRAEFENRKVRLVAISVDPPEKLALMKTSSAAGFDFVSDPEGKLLDRLDVRHRGGNPENGGDVAQSASFLIAPDGRILWRKIAENYRVRPEPAEILAAIDALPAG